MKSFKKSLLRHNLLKLSVAIFALLIVVACLGPLIIGDEGLAPRLENHLMVPNKDAPFGFGVNGISVLTWLIYGARMSLLVSLTVTFISITIGTAMGSLAGFFGGATDAIIARTIDIILAFPGILLSLYLAAVMPPSEFGLIFALSATGWVSYARLIRARMYELRNREFIIAAVALGASSARIIGFHLLPNLMGPVIVQASYGLSAIILAEASLTFLGLGLPVGTPSWGALLDQGVANLFIAPHLAIFPGLCIAITVLAFNFLGDGLRDIFDPKALS